MDNNNVEKEYVEKYIENIKKNISMIEKLSFLDDSYEKNKYIKGLKNWLAEICTKNFMIKKEHSKELVHRYKQRVYWIDFGVNIGSEFNYPHFCVVIKEFDYTAIVVPLSTVKEDDADWKSANNLIIEIGALEDLPNEKKACYALVNQIKTVSKQRLTDYKSEGKFYKIKLSDDQMNKINKAIMTLAGLKIDCNND